MVRKVMALEVVKMKQGMSYSCKEKTIILNVFKYFKTMHPDKCVTEIVRRTAKATGCSEKSVFQFRKEEASAEGFKEPSKTKVRKNININSRFIKYDDTVRQGIRNIIYDLKYRNIVPSLNTLLKHINSDEKLPNFSVMTLRRLLRDMGFYYEKEKVGNKSVLVERPEIKKENLPYNNNKKNQHQVNNVLHPPMQHANINNDIQKQNDVKPFPPTHNNMSMQQNQLYIPNHSHRPLPHPHPLTHHQNEIMDPLYLSSGMIPHQIHSVPHPNIKPDMGFMHHTHPHNIVMQQ